MITAPGLRNCLALVLCLLPFIGSCWVSYLRGVGGQATAPSGIGALLGRTRMMVSGELFLRADAYFHRGQRGDKPTPWDDTWFKRASDVVHPSEHLHLSGDRIQEMMPWLWLSLRADPHNVDAHVTVAFWLSRAMGRHDLAHEVLRVATINNPTNAVLYAERGRIFVRQGRWTESRAMFDHGIAVLEAARSERDDEARFDMAELLFYRSLLDEEGGRLDVARAGYEALLDLFPDRQGVRNRLLALENGAQGPSAGTELTDQIGLQDRNRETQCSHTEEHDEVEGGLHETHVHDEHCTH